MEPLAVGFPCTTEKQEMLPLNNDLTKYQLYGDPWGIQILQMITLLN
jgi:hypothetical protein